MVEAIAVSVVRFRGLERSEREPDSPPVVDDEAWMPTDGSGWQTGRARSQWESLPLPQAPAGVTALAGRVLRLNGKPLPGVTLHLGTATARSDGAGRFLLSDVPSGRVELVVDARTANQPGKTYGFFMIAVDVEARRTTPLPFSIWMPLLDTPHATSLPSPTMGDMIVTTPRIQGLEVHIPLGVRLKDPEGQVE